AHRRADAAQHRDTDSRPEPPPLPDPRRLARLAGRGLDDHQRMTAAGGCDRAWGEVPAPRFQLDDLFFDVGAIERVWPAREVTVVIEQRLIDRAQLPVAFGDVV